MIDLDHPFYKPLWARLLIVGVCAAWAFFEFYSGEPFWGTIVGGAGAYAAYKLFYEFSRRPMGPADQEERQ